ncbi:NAD-dependent epimerase/dehydratase family protein [bacterium]|nr:NAD-dependent epimerase/dehydratase family protein [bacterium]
MLLVAGGAGFVGKNLAKALLERGERVRVFDVRTDLDLAHPNLDVVHGDVGDKDALKSAMRGVDAVFNLVSLLPCSRAGRLFWKVNVEGTENVLEAAQAAGVKRIVHVSSSIVYGKPERIGCDETCRTAPMGDYGRSKLAAEEACRRYMERGQEINIIRPRFIIGAGRLGLLTILFDWVRMGKRIYIIGKGQNRFQMLAYQDLIEACILAWEKDVSGEIFNIGADDTPLLIDQMNSLVENAGTGSKIVRIPGFLARLCLVVLDALRLSPLGTEHYLIADKDFLLDCSKAKRLLGWQPRISAVDALNNTYDWFVKNRAMLTSEMSADFPKQGILRLLRFFS